MDSANENVIRALARVMAEARAGNVEAVAIVAVGNDGVPDASFGGEAELMPSVNLGLDSLKAQFVFRAMKSQEQPVAALRRPAGHG
jgi:hypothetical protein